MLLCWLPGTSLTSSAMVHRYLAAEGIASSASPTLRLPSPLASIPWASQVDGMNCAIPCAPTGERAAGLKLDSCVRSAASRFGVTAGQVSPACSIRVWYLAGTARLSAVDTGSSPAACTRAPTTTAAVAPTPIVTAKEARNEPPPSFLGVLIVFAGQDRHSAPHPGPHPDRHPVLAHRHPGLLGDGGLTVWVRSRVTVRNRISRRR